MDFEDNPLLLSTFAIDTLVEIASQQKPSTFGGSNPNLTENIFCFESERWSGLKVNFFKSEIFGIRVNEDCLLMLADLLGCKAGTLLSSYLGLPLCIRALSKSLWYPVIERLEKKLALWKA